MDGKPRGGPMTQVILNNKIPPSNEWSKLLSNHEFKVALLVARGFSNKNVANELGLSDGTVKVHLNKVFRKLGAKRRYDLIIELSRNSLLTHEQKYLPQVSFPKTIQR